MTRHCPDCDVPMIETDVTAEGIGDLYVDVDRDDAGLLDRLGIGEQRRLAGVCCPECGLTRLYADLPE